MSVIRYLIQLAVSITLSIVSIKGLIWRPGISRKPFNDANALASIFAAADDEIAAIQPLAAI